MDSSMEKAGALNDRARDKREDAPESKGHKERTGFEWKTRITLLKAPLICVAFGRDQNGKVRVAKGHLAIGQFAIGGVAIGQVSLGVISVGQFSFGVISLGQFALAAFAAFGQFAAGIFAIGYFVAGMYAKGEFGWGKFLWTPARTDMEAVATFETARWFFRQDLYTMWHSLEFGLKIGIQKIANMFGG